MALFKTIVTLLIFLALEPVKRVVSAFIYRLAYTRRERLRNMDKQLRPGLLYAPAAGVLAFMGWLLLDDSLVYSQKREYDNKESRYPVWLWRRATAGKAQPEDYPRPGLLAWWWAAVRNSCVNWNNYVAYQVGAFDKVLARYGSARNFYEVRRYASGDVLPYCEFYIAGRWNQVGFLRGSETGSSRFEIDVMKVRK